MLGSRSRVEGDSRSGANEARPHLGILAARGPKQSAKVLRRVGPQQGAHIALVTSVERTEARKSETPRAADIREGLVILECNEAFENTELSLLNDPAQQPGPPEWATKS